MINKELKKIIYVDDDPDLRRIVKFSLETLGNYQVQVYCDGKEFLSEVVSIKPDLIMIDVIMPIIDGPAAVQKLRKIPEVKDIPVIFLTSKYNPRDIEQFNALGVPYLIKKPFDPSVLHQQVLEIWQKHLG